MQPVRMFRRVVRFSVFEVDIDSAELRKNGGKQKIQEQPFQILLLLLDRPGEIVTREELQQQLWPEGTFVDFEHGVNTAVKKLREALGDDADNPRFIETVPRRGYRFIAPLHSDRTDSAPTPTSQSRPSSRRRILLLAGLLALVGITVVTWRIVTGSRAGPRMQNMVQLTFSGQNTGCSYEVPQSIQTDGSRVYFSDVACRLRYVSVQGGQEVLIDTALESLLVLLHISPDRSTLLAREFIGSQGASESRLWLVPANGGAPRRLGDIEAQDAAFSADATTIAYARGESLYLCDRRGQSPRKIATVVGRAFWLRWSPDGKRLRFTLRDEKSGSLKLWETDLDGSVHELLPKWTGAEEHCCGIWAANGDYFFLARTSHGPTQIWSLPKHLSFWPDVYPTRVSAPGTGGFGSIVASPTERKLFVLGDRGVTEVVAVDLATKRSTRLLPDRSPMEVSFSRDGKWVAFVQPHHDGAELWRSRADGTGMLQLTEPPLFPFMPGFSPDGSRIAFAGNLPGQPLKIYWVSSDGGGLHEIAPDVTSQVDPTWLPDGSIVFGEPPHILAESGKPKAIYIWKIETQETLKLPGSDGWFSPRVSPDGRFVAAMSIDMKRLGLFDFEEGKWRTLDKPGLLDNPFWSHDNRWVYFNNGRDFLWRVRARDGRKEPVLSFSNIPGRDCVPRRFSPEGALLFSCRRKNSDIYAISLE